MTSSNIDTQILPSLTAVILFCTYILPAIGSGPLWPTVIDHHAMLCKKYLWRNVLFIHNYFGFENMCLTHTHQLGIDMQLFLLTPIITKLIWFRKRTGLLTILCIGIASTILRFCVTYNNEISSVIYFGIPVSKMFASADLSYILPTHRATIYIVGIYLAYLLNESNQKVIVTKTKSTILWILALAIFFSTWLGPYKMVDKNYVYEKIENSVISAITPIFWGISIGFAIYAIQHNFGGPLGKILCWRYFQACTKIAYAIYLVQFPVFFYNVGVTKHAEEYHPHLLLQFYEASAIFVFSVLLVLLIEMPFQNLKEVLFRKRVYKEKYNILKRG